MDSIRRISQSILLFTLLAAPQVFADKLASVSLERMTNDSDLVFVGHVIKQDMAKNGFLVIDVDGKEKALDVAITTFSTEEALKGANRPTTRVCSILNPLKYADIEVGKTYIIFVQKTGKYYQRTYGSMSQIEISDGRVIAHYFNDSDKELETPETIKKAVAQSSPRGKKHVRGSPYNPYSMTPYKIIKNVCEGA